MKLASSRPFVGIAVGLLFSAASLALDLDQDPAPADYLFGTGMSLPVENREKVFRPASNRANFTSFHGVENTAVEDGKLAFTLVDKRALLGWGNCGGKQPAGEIREMGQQTIVVRPSGAGGPSTCGATDSASRPPRRPRSKAPIGRSSSSRP